MFGFSSYILPWLLYANEENVNNDVSKNLPIQLYFQLIRDSIFDVNGLR